jgi:hypothetical protein
MTVFKEVVAGHLKLIFFIFVLGKGMHVVPVNQTNSCGSDLYLSLHTTQKCLAFESFSAMMLFLTVLMVINDS